MDLFSLPDEMLASIQKYGSFDDILNYRRTSSRMDEVAKRYYLHRVECDRIQIEIGTMFKSEEDINRKRKQVEDGILSCSQRFKTREDAEHGLEIEGLRRKKKELMSKPKVDGIDHRFCTVRVWLKGAAKAKRMEDWTSIEKLEGYMSYHRCIVERYTHEENRYAALDRILKKVSCTGEFWIRSGIYNAELDTCLFRNRRTFRSVKHIIKIDVIGKNEMNKLKFHDEMKKRGAEVSEYKAFV